MELSQIIEALLFASPEPVSAQHLAKLVREAAEKPADGEAPGDLEAFRKLKPEQVVEVIAGLNAHYLDTGRAFRASERATGWKLLSLPDFGHWVRELFPGKKPSRLSPPALETLAIIAYRQPLAKAAVEAVRGVSIDGVLNTLLDRGLVRIGGRADLPGRPLLYETTEIFLEHFGIKDISELPNAAELRQVRLPDTTTPTSQPDESGAADESSAAGETAPVADPDNGDTLVAAYEPGEEELDALEEPAPASD